MIDIVRKFFSRNEGKERPDREDGPSHDVKVAACALMIEMSNIDGTIRSSERDAVLEILKREHGLSEEHAAALMEASGKELERSTDLWQFARLINDNYSIEEKIRIIETIWEIAFRDGKLDKHEDYLVHKLARLLRLTHRQLIDAKLKVKKAAAAG